MQDCYDLDHGRLMLDCPDLEHNKHIHIYLDLDRVTVAARIWTIPETVMILIMLLFGCMTAIIGTMFRYIHSYHDLDHVHIATIIWTVHVRLA